MGFEPLEVVFAPAGRADLLQARTWYGEKDPLLGQAFSSRVQEAIQRISHQPEGGREIHRSVRRVVLRQFPYLIFYRVEEKRVVVVGCRHQREDPSGWPAA